MGFWRHYTALLKKNFILYKRNWKGSLCEILCPITLFLLVLIMRFIFVKEERVESHLFSTGYVWYDDYNNPSNGYLGYYIFDEGTDWFGRCTGRSYGPDRTIVALAPTGNQYVNDLKTVIEDSLVNEKGMFVKIYPSRDAIMEIIGDSNYEKDGNPGI